MTVAKISLAESALSDLAGIQEWHAEEGVPKVGDRLVTEIIEHFEVLADHPDIGRIVPEFGQPFLRELIHPPFRIIDPRDSQRVRIVRVWRSERLLRLPASASSQDTEGLPPSGETGFATRSRMLEAPNKTPRVRLAAGKPGTVHGFSSPAPPPRPWPWPA